MSSLHALGNNAEQIRTALGRYKNRWWCIQLPCETGPEPSPEQRGRARSPPANRPRLDIREEPSHPRFDRSESPRSE